MVPREASNCSHSRASEGSFWPGGSVALDDLAAQFVGDLGVQGNGHGRHATTWTYKTGSRGSAEFSVIELLTWVNTE